MAKSKSKRLYLYGSALGLLLIPAIATQLTDQVNWSRMDFVIAASLLFTLALGIDLLSKLIEIRRSRLLCFTILVLIFILIWAELAVGLFGTRWAGS